MSDSKTIISSVFEKVRQFINHSCFTPENLQSNCIEKIQTNIYII